jgi:hypothetical protein
MEHTNTLYGKNAEFYFVKASGMHRLYNVNIVTCRGAAGDL